MMNAIDGCGGANIGYGAPEIATAGRDGAVKICTHSVLVCSCLANCQNFDAVLFA
jgi:hypothetical protein